MKGMWKGRLGSGTWCREVWQIFNVPQPEYPDDVGGRFLQFVSTSQKTAFVKTPNPTNLLNWGRGERGYSLYKWVSWDSSCFESPRFNAKYLSPQQQFCPVSVTGVGVPKSGAPGRPTRLEFCMVVPKMCRPWYETRSMSSVCRHEFWSGS